MEKKLPFTKEDIKKWVSTEATPFYVYDEEAILNNAKGLFNAFSWNKGFKEYFAIKALPTPGVLRVLKSAGCGFDCASVSELTMAQILKVTGSDIMFSSNQTSVEEYRKALELGATINFDDISQIAQLEKAGSVPERVCVRYNPGSFMDSDELMSNKFGMSEATLTKALCILRDKGAKEFGIHAMLSGNSIDNDYYPTLAADLFKLCVRVKEATGIKVSFVDLSGGIGIDYLPESKKVDIAYVGNRVKEEYEKIVVPKGLEISICTELGRYMTGPFGYLVTTVIGMKHQYRDYVGLDASACDHMRPAMYGAYHHIIVSGKEDLPLDHKYDVVGSLCENNDKFAVERMLPEIELGDNLVICDSGAHSRSMGYNYNGKMRCGEYLMDKDKNLKIVRRRETLKDYFATFDVDEEFNTIL